MAGNSFGRILRLTSYGESHGPGLGGVLDGCPAGLPLSEEDLQRELDLRKPGQGATATKRKESDTVRILSGVFQGLTTGTPIAFHIANEDQRSRDYGNLAQVFRPGHADWGFATTAAAAAPPGARPWPVWRPGPSPKSCWPRAASGSWPGPWSWAASPCPPKHAIRTRP